MISIENFTINFINSSLEPNDLLDTKNSLLVRDELVNLLRIIGEDSRFFGQSVIIPNDCEQYGFAEGDHELPKLLYFLADMLE